MKNKIKGALYGIAVGDALGAPFEGWRPKSIMNRFGVIKDHQSFDGWDLGEFTDDTWLTLATARAYDGYTFTPEKAALAMVIWMRNIGKGIGKLTNIALSNISSGRCDIYTSGHKALASVGNRGASNGSLMRCISTGLIHSPQNVHLIVKESTILSEITHADPRCVSACVGYNVVVSELLDDNNISNALLSGYERVQSNSDVSDVFRYVIRDKASRFDPNSMESNGYVLRALDRALIAARNADDFESEMIKVINEGGDTDTNAAIAGGLLGVIFGYDAIPQRWIEPLMNKDEIDEAVELIVKYRTALNET